MVELWVWGAALCTVANVSVNVGMNLMKAGYTSIDRAAELNAASQRGPDKEAPEETQQNSPKIWNSWMWRLGVICFLAGNIGNFASLGLAAQSMIAAMSSVQFVSNVACVRFLHRETVPGRVYAATAAILAGNILMVVFSSKSSPLYTVADLKAFYTRLPYIIYLAALAVVVPIAYALFRLGLTKLEQEASISSRGAWVKSVPLCFALYAALPGTQAVMLSKSLAVIGVRWIVAGDNPFTEWYTYVVVALLAAIAVFWVSRMDQGIQIFDAVMIIPLLQLAWTLFGILCGGIYFAEFDAFTFLQASRPMLTMMFALGVAIILVGVYLLVPSGAPASIEREDNVIATITVISPPSSAASRKTSRGQSASSAVHDNPLWEALEAGPSPEGALPAAPPPPPPTQARRRAVGFQEEAEQCGSAGSRESFRSRMSSLVSHISAQSGAMRHSILQDVSASARLTVGLGEQERARALSLFGLPMMPLDSAQVSSGREMAAGPPHEAAPRASLGPATCGLTLAAFMREAGGGGGTGGRARPSAVAAEALGMPREALRFTFKEDAPNAAE
eukprot:jgi/Tetstr1/427201/TSEL_017389.t1